MCAPGIPEGLPLMNSDVWVGLNERFPMIVTGYIPITPSPGLETSDSEVVGVLGPYSTPFTSGSWDAFTMQTRPGCFISRHSDERAVLPEDGGLNSPRLNPSASRLSLKG